MIGPQDAMPATSAIVLAGGRSTRMGRDKATTLLAGRSLLQRTIDAAGLVPGVSEVVLVLAPEQPPPPVQCGLPFVLTRDRTEGEGPLAAIAVGLEVANSEVCLVLSCDTPFVRPALLALLLEHARDQTIVVPTHGGRPQPLCSALRQEALPIVHALLNAGVRAPSALAERLDALLVAEEDWRSADPEALSFVGVNTPEELAHAETLAARLDVMR